ncbi:MAG: AAA family ATPase [Blautia sp.]|nr:AAA family ATPase [Blautia sp.]MCM1201349.1 AAA family ATPase [Bacteroides fragilis]
MINKVRIKALKSIQDLTIDCSRFNLIVGTNSAGKSTFLQALLLDAQNSIDKSGLNGPLISLGEYREAHNYSMPDANIKIWIWKNGYKEPAWIEFSEDLENSCKVTVSGEPDDLDLIMDDADFHMDEATHLYWKTGFRYLSCHRLGPQDIYVKYFGNDNNLGIDGEYSFSYLMQHELDPVADELVKNKEDSINSLYEQVNYWLNYIVGTSLLVTDIKKTNYLQVKYNNNPANLNSEAMYNRPVNVGSGISYLVTILITCLASNTGDIILIENPEIHLHPKAQSRLCEFLYFISSSGRQLFVETHSDHIFNGIRVGISNKTMREDYIKVNFFMIDKNYNTQCNPIKFGDFGKITGMNRELDINDLFDQFEIDLDRMLGL